jgi:hypothetical protein
VFNEIPVDIGVNLADNPVGINFYPCMGRIKDQELVMILWYWFDINLQFTNSGLIHNICRKGKLSVNEK